MTSAKLYNNCFCKLIINIISCVLNSYDAASFEVTHYRDNFPGVTAERKKEGIKLPIIGFDLAYDIFNTVLRLS